MRCSGLQNLSESPKGDFRQSQRNDTGRSFLFSLCFLNTVSHQIPPYLNGQSAAVVEYNAVGLGVIFVEDVAKEKLGLVNPNEILFKAAP